MTADERRLEQARWAWTNQYGPAKAEALLAEVAALQAAEPTLDLKAAIDQIDPESEDDYDAFCASRW